MAEEESIQKQVAAMEKFALEAKKKVEQGEWEYKLIEELLRDINNQGKKLEWRGGLTGLKHLPEMEEVEALRKNITEARAAVAQARSFIDYLKKLNKKGEKKPEVIAAIQKKEKSYQEKIVNSIKILTSVLFQAVDIIKKEPWINPKVLSRIDIRPEMKKQLILLLTGSGYYEHLSPEERKNIIKDIRIYSGNLDGANLAGAELYLIHFEDVSFKKANLRGAKLTAPSFKNADLSGADLREMEVSDISAGDFAGAILNHANFSGANLYWANFYKASLQNAIFVKAFVSGANFTSADLSWADFSGADFGTKVRLKDADLEEVNLKDAKNLTREQLRLAKNWLTTKHRPRELG